MYSQLGMWINYELKPGIIPKTVTKTIASANSIDEIAAGAHCHARRKN